MQEGKILYGIPGVKNPMWLGDRIVVSAQPEPLGYIALKDLCGVVKTFNFNSNDSRKTAEQTGLQFFYYPFSRVEITPPNVLDHIVTSIWEASLKDIVHANCWQGCDLSGTFRAAVRMKYMGWGFPDAMEERDRFGFHECWREWLDPTIKDYANCIGAKDIPL
jgi:hypothetical protein